MKYMNVAKKYGVGIAAVGMATHALAAPDAEAITTAITGVGDTVDTVGGAMVTVFVGLMVFGVIIGMIMRKGK